MTSVEYVGLGYSTKSYINMEVSYLNWDLVNSTIYHIYYQF